MKTFKEYLSEDKLKFEIHGVNLTDKTITVSINNIRYEYFYNYNIDVQTLYNKAKFMMRWPGKALNFLKSKSESVKKL